MHDARGRGNLRIGVRGDVLCHEVEEAAVVLQHLQQDQRLAAGTGGGHRDRGGRRGRSRPRRGRFADPTLADPDAVGAPAA